MCNSVPSASRRSVSRTDASRPRGGTDMAPPRRLSRTRRGTASPTLTRNRPAHADTSDNRLSYRSVVVSQKTMVASQRVERTPPARSRSVIRLCPGQGEKVLTSWAGSRADDRLDQRAVPTGLRHCVIYCILIVLSLRQGVHHERRQAVQQRRPEGVPYESVPSDRAGRARSPCIRSSARAGSAWLVSATINWARRDEEGLQVWDHARDQW